MKLYNEELINLKRNVIAIYKNIFSVVNFDKNMSNYMLNEISIKRSDTVSFNIVSLIDRNYSGIYVEKVIYIYGK